MKILIWRDAVDPRLYSLGFLPGKGLDHPQEFARLWSDDVVELIDTASLVLVDAQPGKPVEAEITVRVLP